jgi:hypothetical protein
MTRIGWRTLNCLVTAAWLLASAAPRTASAKSYSGGGHSYSSHSSSGGSHSYSSGSHSYGSSGSSRSSSSPGSSKSFSSGSHSYSSSSSHDDSNRHGYSSGKSYGSGSSPVFSSKPPSRDSSKSSGSSSKSSKADSGFSFDAAASRAQKERTSKSDYTKFKESKTPPVIPSDNRSTASRPPSSSGGGWTSGTWRNHDNWDYRRRGYVYVPDVMVIRTRPARIYNVFGGYTYRPWVTYNDPFSSLFWWWLLDRSIDDQAWWAYHHRYDMDPSRYQALMANNQQLGARVAQLEAQQQVPRDPSYTPTGLDRDLMYSDHYVAQSYSNRPTRSGSAAFWVIGVPLAAGFCGFLIWLIWFKRWQTVT